MSISALVLYNKAQTSYTKTSIAFACKHFCFYGILIKLSLMVNIWTPGDEFSFYKFKSLVCFDSQEQEKERRMLKEVKFLVLFCLLFIMSGISLHFELQRCIYTTSNYCFKYGILLFTAGFTVPLVTVTTTRNNIILFDNQCRTMVYTWWLDRPSRCHIMYGVATRTAELYWQSMGARHSINKAVYRLTS